MFDYHMHSRVSFDGHDTGLNMARAALEAGLKEICFTDHLDCDILNPSNVIHFETEAYNAEYDTLEVPGLIIRRGQGKKRTPDALHRGFCDVCVSCSAVHLQLLSDPHNGGLRRRS